jgi:CheY-like chemotaxis protein
MLASADIFIVEDEADIRDTLADILESEGYAIAAAANGREALDKLSVSAPPKVILLDLLMPVMNGLEFRLEQSLRPGIAGVPVVLMSADYQTQQKAEKMGVAHLRKPLDLDCLVTTLKKYFQ